jgi:hypothetical protein
LIVIGEKAETTHTIRMVPTPLDYWITTTYARERMYRAWWISQHKNVPLIEVYRQLARKFPFGLADVEPLPEEQSMEVAKGVQK